MIKEHFKKEYCSTCGSLRCEGVNDETMREGCLYYKKMFGSTITNYEKIKSMSIDEMADFICGIYDDEEDNAKFINGIVIPAYNSHDIKDWLERESEF